MRTKVSCSPRSQGPTRNGPLPIGSPVFGLSIRSIQISGEILPRERVLAEGRSGKRFRQPAKRERSTTLTVFASSCGRYALRRSPASKPGAEYLRIALSREDEVARGDRDAVAPASLGTNVVGERERRLRRERDTRDELRSQLRSRDRTLNAPSRTLAEGDPRRMSLMTEVETDGLASRTGTKTTVPPRFGVCAPTPPAPDTARSETTIALRLLALEPPVLRVPQRVARVQHVAAHRCSPGGADDERVERDHGDVPRELSIGSVEYSRPLLLVEDSLRLVELFRDQPLAVPA